MIFTWFGDGIGPGEPISAKCSVGLDSRADFPKAPPYEEALRNAKVPVPSFGIAFGFGMVLGLVLNGLGTAWDYVGMVLDWFLHWLGMVLGPVSLLVLSAW